MTAMTAITTDMPTVRMPSPIFDAIVAHSREGKPEEICGVMRGRGTDIYQIYRARNIADERIENYIVEPRALLLQFEFEDTGDEMMGIYHSHPVSVAYPSATDAWNAHYPDSIYFICSLEYDDAPVIRAFQMTPHFIDQDIGLDIVALRTQLTFYETRAELFGYYQSLDDELPAALAAIDAQIAPPFYIVYHAAAGPDGMPDGRIVTVREYPVELIG